MNLFNTIERRCSWLSIPHIWKWYAYTEAFIFVLKILRPELGSQLNFDSEKIFIDHEWWRTITHCFCSPLIMSKGIKPFDPVFMFFSVMITSMISNHLEAVWGSVKSTIYFLLSYAAITFSHLLISNDLNLFNSGWMMYLSLFFVFATLFPKAQFSLYGILPVQTRWLAIIIAAMLVFQIIGLPPLVMLILLAKLLLMLSPYLLCCGIPAALQMRKIASHQKNSAFNIVKRNAPSHFHQCSVCQKTEISDPKLLFVVAANGDEFCEQHSPVSH